MADTNSNTTKGVIIGGLVVLVAVLAFFLFQGEADKPDLAIDVSEEGISIEGN